jgi:uncharacterized membrane protein (DUF373 family)
LHLIAWNLRKRSFIGSSVEPVGRKHWNNVAQEQKIITHPVRQSVLQVLGLAEDLVYAGVGLLLAIAALAFLAIALKGIVSALFTNALPGQIVSILDEILLILLIVELLYTVQVSFREHRLIAEPFLVVALIAVIRRVLVLTAELPKLPEASGSVFNRAVIELSLLIVMIFVLVASFIMLQKLTRQKSRSTDEGANS